MVKRDAQTLLENLRDASFTPSVREVGGILDHLQNVDESTLKFIERALLRVGSSAVPAILGRLPDSRRPMRGHLVKILGRFARETQGAHRAALTQTMTGLLDDEDLKTRRNAIIALGHLPLPGVEDALLDKWNREDRIDHRRSLAASLGKIGGAASLAALRSFTADDAELKKIIGQALLILERQISRTSEAPSTIPGDVQAAFSVPVTLECREGLEKILASEFDPSWRPKVLEKGRVGVVLRGPLTDVFQARTFLTFGISLPPLRGPAVDTVVRALTGDLALRIFKTWTRGAVRYRLEWAGAGHRRSAVWECAKRISEKCSDLTNDPSDSTWEAVVHETGDGTRIDLHPKKLPDPRFQYRLADVYAASHPTIAAALARVAGAKKDDVIWDPFAGCGTELIERALAGPCLEIHGTDLDPRAIDAARKNLKTAGVAARLSVADGLVHKVPNATLIISNPPMGRRSRRGDVGSLLKRFLEHAASLLAAHGRLVWVSPTPERHIAEAKQAGLEIRFQQNIDMGGFGGQIQRYEKI